MVIDAVLTHHCTSSCKYCFVHITSLHLSERLDAHHVVLLVVGFLPLHIGDLMLSTAPPITSLCRMSACFLHITVPHAAFRFNVEYPALYADEKNCPNEAHRLKFNCTQRAHLNRCGMVGHSQATAEGVVSLPVMSRAAWTQGAQTAAVRAAAAASVAIVCAARDGRCVLPAAFWEPQRQEACLGL